MSKKKDWALEVCYSNSCAARRLGTTPEAVEEAKRRARENPQKDEDISDTDITIGAAGFEVSIGLDGGVGLSVPGISIAVERNGEGEISFPGDMRMEVVKEGCYFIKNFYFKDQLAYQDMELDPKCEEEIKEEEEREVEPQDPNYDDDDDINSEDDPRLREDLGPSFDEEDDGLSDNAIYCCIYGYHMQSYYSYNYSMIAGSALIKEKISIDRIRYQVENWRERKGVRYPHKIKRTRTVSENRSYKNHSGEITTTSDQHESESTHYASTEYDEPFCGNLIGGFEIGYGRTIKSGAKQKRFKRYAYRPDHIRSYSNYYKGYDRQLVDGEYQNLCPYSEARYLEHTTVTPITQSQSSASTEYKLLYSKILKYPEEKGKPPGNIGKKDPPKMAKDCCKLIKKIYKVLDVDGIETEGFVIPARLLAPNAKGTIKADTYPEMLALQIQIADHLGLHPFKSSLSDANAAQAGNQKVEIQFASGTAALNKIVELLLENKGDSASRLNLQVRSALIQAQILQVASICAKTLEAIGNFLGMPLQEKISWVKMPFDVSLGARKKQKGFDPKQQQSNTVEQISINTEAATEEILPELLKEGSQPIAHPKFTGKGIPSLMELIRGIKFDE